MPAKKLSHIKPTGEAHMVDVGGKAATLRVARASAVVQASPATVRLIESASLAKGDVLATARLAGIQAAKLTPQLIPLCHVLPLDAVELEIRTDAKTGRVLIEAEVRTTAKTGVEMEAIVAVSIAAATVYDMCKSAEKTIQVGPIQLESKTGGKSGDWQRANAVRKK